MTGDSGWILKGNLLFTLERKVGKQKYVIDFSRVKGNYFSWTVWEGETLIEDNKELTINLCILSCNKKIREDSNNESGNS
jgi:hypothetical protein